MRRVPLAFILSLLVAAPLAAQQTTAIPLLINHLVSDPVSGKLYGSVPSSAGANGNSIAVINPVTASVEQYLPIGAEPYRLAVSDDGQYLYVGLNGEFAVVPVHLPTLAVGTRFALGSFVARDIDVMPGSPQTVAVVLSDAEMHYGGNTVVYDNGTPRSTAGCDAMHIAFVPDGTGIFAARYGSQDRTYSLRRCDVTAAGVVNETTIHQDVYYGDAVASGNLLFATTGRVLDMTTRDPVAHLDRAAMYAVAPAVSRGLAYFATTAGTTTGEGTITALDLSTKRFAFAYPTPGLQFAQPRGLVTWGTDGLAYWTAGTATTAGAVYVTSLAATATLAVAKQGTGFGSITSSPARIFCGSEFSRFCSALFPADASVTLTATPDATSRFVGWQGDADCADGVVTMSAARTCTAVFAASMPRPLTALPFATNDLVYASSIGRILASIPADDPVWGNAIVAIDPATGEIGHSVWVGSQPNRLALSEDESVLYVGLDGQAAVISVSLPAFTAGTPFQLGFSSTPEPYLAADLAVISGSPSSVAVLRAAATLATTYSPALGSVGVYDNGVRRPNVTSDGSASWIAASPAATRVYGVELPEQGAKFVRFNIDANGVTLLDRTDGLIGRSPIVQASGRVFAETGEAIDPEALTRLGTFPVLGGLGVAPDPASGLVYFLDRSSNIRVFDTEQFTPRQSLKTRWLEPPPRLALLGPRRLAYRVSPYQVGIVQLPARPVQHDINFDGRPDILWHDRQAGTLLVWNMDGGKLVSTSHIIGSTDLNWRVAALADFNGDGMQDILWRHAVTGQNHLWYMDGTTFLSSQPVIAVPDPSWHVVGTGYFDADDKPDLLWQNLATGQSVLWYMNGAARTGYAAIKPASLPWQMAGVGDLDGDGKPDIVLRNPATGENGAWFMNGAAFVRAELMASAAPGWTLADVADFNFDGRADLLWRSTGTGENILWYMNGAGRISRESLPPQTAQYDVLGGPPGRGAAGGNGTDFNGDGKPDLLWQNETSGERILWYMDGAAYTGYEWLQAVTDTTWRAVGTADMNADGQTDILWRNTVSGENLVWLMSHSTFLRSEPLTQVPDVGWELAATADWNKDGWADLVWRHRTTGENILWYMTGTTYRSYVRLQTVTDPAWRIVGGADFIRDGNIDLLWRNATTGENVIWEMNYVAARVAARRLPAVTDAAWHATSIADFNFDGSVDIVWRNTTTGENIVWFLNGTAYTGYQRLRSVTDPAWTIVPDRQ